MAPASEKVKRGVLILAGLLAACSLLPDMPWTKKEIERIPEIIVQEPAAAIETKKREPARPRRVTRPAGAPVTEYTLINPLADCLNSIIDPTEAARAKLDCMKERLGIKPQGENTEK